MTQYIKLTVFIVYIVCAAIASMLHAQDLITSPIVQVASGLNFPEGPAFDGRTGLVVSNCYGGYIARFRTDGKPVRSIDTAFAAGGASSLLQKTNGLTYYRDGSLFVCDFGRRAIIRIFPDGRQEIYADSCEGTPFLGPNDLAFDPKGNLFFTDPLGTSEKNPRGAVYCVFGSPDESPAKRVVVRVAEGLAFPNGIAISRSGKYVFVAESRTFQIVRYTVHINTKPDRRKGRRAATKRAAIELDEKIVVATMPTEHDPDGIAFDQAGRLWVAQYGAGKVCVFSPQGRLVGTVDFPAKNITNLEFAGEQRTTLFITAADTNALYSVEVKIPGLQLLCAPDGKKMSPPRRGHSYRRGEQE
jgi:sugar lactone lactonase YvrE